MPYVLLVLGVIARLIPHPWNFTPIGALGLFAGANCRPQVAWAVPIGALLIGDLMVGFYNPITMIFVYLGFLSGPLLGRLLIAPRRSAGRIGGAVLASSTIFYLLSNFGIWLDGFYPMTFAGLIECYVRAMPYYGLTILGDGLYATILFGGHELLLSTWRRQTGRYAQS